MMKIAYNPDTGRIYRVVPDHEIYHLDLPVVYLEIDELQNVEVAQLVRDKPHKFKHSNGNLIEMTDSGEVEHTLATITAAIATVRNKHRNKPCANLSNAEVKELLVALLQLHGWVKQDGIIV